MSRYIVLALKLFLITGCGGGCSGTGTTSPLVTEEPDVPSPTPTPTPTPEIVVAPKPEKTQIFVIGDSTVANYGSSYYPQTGWGQVRQTYFDEEKVQIENRARGGRSSRSFYS